MNSEKDVIRVWGDRLDKWCLSRASVSMASKTKRDKSAGEKLPGKQVWDGLAGTRSLLPRRCRIALDNEATSLTLRSARSFTVLVCSRLGHDPHHHWQLGQLLMRSARQARFQAAVLLVADGSAIEPWARRASKLTGATLLRIGFGNRVQQTGAQVWVRFPEGVEVTRDQGIITIADRIDALHVRRGGRVEACLKKRLQPTSQCSVSRCAVRVGVTAAPASAASNLIKAGAVGWYLTEAIDGGDSVDKLTRNFGMHQHEVDNKRVLVASKALGLCTTRNWLNEPGQWLVHCTRGSKGPWPGETPTEYRDAILTQGRRVANRTALDALCRIIHSGEIMSSAIVSSRQYPVVCWSAVPLLQLLRQRCFRSHVQRWDYEPYGIAVRLEAIRELGGRPVIYGRSGEAGKLPVGERFRHQAAGKSIDWRKEKEWRLACSLSLKSLKPCDVRIFALDSGLARSRLVNLAWKVTIIKHVSKRTLKKTGNDGLSEIWKAV